MSKQYRELFNKYPQCIGSMSAPATPTDNSVAERFVRTLNRQLIKGGEWPSTFESMRKAEKFLQEKVRSFNEEFKGAALNRLPPSELHRALTQEEHKAPLVVAHWKARKGEVSDLISTEIEKFKREATESWKPANWFPENSLKKAEHYAAIAARGAINQEGVNDQVLNQLKIQSFRLNISIKLELYNVQFEFEVWV